MNASPAHDPRLHWVQADWLAEATAWIHERLEEQRTSITGELEQLHVRWWSTVIRVPTGESHLWFKAAAPVHAFEAPLALLLQRLQPGRVPKLVASDTERGWMLMRDGGTRLRELMRSPADLARWEEVLAGYADFQLALAPHADALLEAGVPDERLATLPGRVERLLDDDEALLLGRPDEGITPGEREQLRALLPELRATARDLAALGLPETLQHDDFHDGNVFVRDGRYLFFDWGDSCVSHPFHTLVVTFRSLAHGFGLDPGGSELTRLRAAYLEPFSPYGSADDLVAATELAHVTGTAARALAWHRFVSSREAEFRADDAEAVPYGLKRLLDLGPLGSY